MARQSRPVQNVTFGALRTAHRAPTVATMENITPAPAKRALAVLDQPAPTVPPDAPKRISKKVRAAIDLMVSGECKKIIDAAAKVGLARESLSRALSTPHVAEHLRQKVRRTKRENGLGGNRKFEGPGGICHSIAFDAAAHHRRGVEAFLLHR